MILNYLHIIEQFAVVVMLSPKRLTCFNREINAIRIHVADEIWNIISD